MNQSPETPEEMRNLDNEKKEGRRRREGDERRGGGEEGDKNERFKLISS